MTVYAVAQFRITDQTRYQRYLANFMDILKKYDGCLIASDPGPIVVEGAWEHEKIVILAFADSDKLGTWANSPEYQEISKDRIAGTQGCVLVVKGTGA